jgi:hypothetical protein
MDDGSLSHDLAAMVTDIINDDIDDTVRARLRRCRPQAIPKPGGGVRPICVGESLLKVSSSVVNHIHRDMLQSHFKDLQYGVGTPSGAEKIVHRVAREVSQGNLVVTLDATNAFNTPFRSAMRATLLSDPKWQPYHNLFNLCYAEPSELLFRQGPDSTVIMSERGCRQGDPLGALLFALVIHPIAFIFSESMKNGKWKIIVNEEIG